MTGIERIIFLGVYGLCVSALVFTRRYKNGDAYAGMRISGWGLVGLIALAAALVPGAAF